MSTAHFHKLISIGDYLNGELNSTTKHEYVGGLIYAMAGGSNAHNLIATNILGRLFSRLGGQSCRPFNSDTKIRIRLASEVRFYYPDVSIICSPNPQTDSFQDNPVAIFEVLSRQTRRIDEGEKKMAYFMIPSLSNYILVETDAMAVVAYHRTENGFVPEIYSGFQDILPLPELGTELPLAEIYEGVDLQT